METLFGITALNKEKKNVKRCKLKQLEQQRAQQNSFLLTLSVLKSMGLTEKKGRKDHKLTLFFKMKSNLTPFHVSSLIPQNVGSLSQLNVGNADKLHTTNFRTNQYFLPFCLLLLETGTISLLMLLLITTLLDLFVIYIFIFMTVSKS